MTLSKPIKNKLHRQLVHKQYNRLYNELIQSQIHIDHLYDQLFCRLENQIVNRNHDEIFDKLV